MLNDFHEPMAALDVRYAPALIERQEPRTFALEMRTHAHLVIIHSKVHHAAPELKEQFAWVAVAFVLLHRILDGLLGQAVLQLEGGNRHPIDEKAEVERELCLIAAVAQLSGNTEAIGCEALDSFHIAG